MSRPPWRATRLRNGTVALFVLADTSALRTMAAGIEQELAVIEKLVSQQLGESAFADPWVLASQSLNHLQDVARTTPRRRCGNNCQAHGKP